MIHRLDGVLTENLHGWFDNGLEPLLRIAPGDSVVYRTADSGWDDRTPGKVETEGRRPEGAGHALAGPIWVEGAKPGDTLEVRIHEVVARDWGFVVHRPGRAAISGILGGHQDDVEEEYRRHIFLDRERGVWRFNERIEVPLAPFMGIFAVAPTADGRTLTTHPGPHGGNRDCKELGAAWRAG